MVKFTDVGELDTLRTQKVNNRCLLLELLEGKAVLKSFP